MTLVPFPPLLATTCTDRGLATPLRIGVFPATGPIPASAANIHSPARIGAFIYGSAAQPLTQIHKVNLAVYQARLGISLAKEGLRAQQQETARQVKEAYYQVAQLQAQVARSSSEKLAFNDVEVGVSDS
jgi:hypothetical protein